MLDEFAGIDTDPKPTPIVSIFQMMLVCGEARWPPKRASVLAAVNLLQLQSR